MPDIKYTQLCVELEERLLDGSYSGKLPGVHRLAAEFHTSPVTMGKALKLLERRGYIAILDRRGAFVTLRNQGRPCRKLICLVNSLGHPGPEDTMYRTTLATVQKSGYQLLVLGAGSLEILRNEDFLTAINVDGYVFSNSVLDIQIARNLQLNGIPFVSVNQINEPSTVNLVEFDHVDGRRKLYQYLYDLGHRHIAEIIPANRLDFWRKKLHEIYRTFMEEHQIYDPACYVGSNRSLPERGAPDEASELERFNLACINRLLQLPAPPSAIVVNDLRTGEKLRQVLAEQHRNIPRHISLALAGSWDSEIPCDPFYTYVLGDCLERQHAACELLIRQLEEPAPAVKLQWLKMKFQPGPSADPVPSF